MRGLATLPTLIIIGIVTTSIILGILMPLFLFRYHINIRIKYNFEHRRSFLFLISLFNNQYQRERLGNYLGNLESDSGLTEFFQKYGITCYKIVFPNEEISEGDCELKTKITIPVPKPFNPDKKTETVSWWFE